MPTAPLGTRTPTRRESIHGGSAAPSLALKVGFAGTQCGSGCHQR
ncbi:hypothetical protein [Marinobacterium stanieri]|nr:hypothetical protein [Marinobacterium stanieri]